MVGLFGAALESGRLYLSDSISDVGRVRLYHRALDQLFIAKADPVFAGDPDEGHSSGSCGSAGD